MSANKPFSINKLFISRWIHYWKYQYQALRIVIDWIIALYFIVPLFIITGYHYYSWWQTTPQWMINVPFAVVITGLFYLSRNGIVRLYVEEADQLYMMQRKRWFRGVMFRGMLYTVFFNVLFIATLVFLLAPMLIVTYSYTAANLFGLCLFLCTYRTFCALIQNRIKIRFNGILYWLLFILIQMILFAPFYSIIFFQLHHTMTLVALGFLLTVMNIVLIYKRLEVKGSFARDIEQEQRQKIKLAGLILHRYIDKKSRIFRARPLLFRNSNLLFKERTAENGLAEMGIKSFVRSWAHIKTYFIIVGFGMIVVSIPFIPNLIKGILWIVFAFILSYWLKSYWKELMESPSSALFTWKKEQISQAAKKTILIMMLPGFLLISAMYGYSSNTWIGMLTMVPFGAMIGYYASRMMSSLL